MILRPYQPRDSEGVIALIDAIYREYGFQICLENSESDLRDIPAHFPENTFMVLIDSGHTVRGTVALTPDAQRPKVCWLKRLYLDTTLRGGGNARDLMAWAYDTAAAWDMDRMELWSDTEFTRAHAFYEAQGFQRDGRMRDMDDGYAPYAEYFFYRELT